MSALILPVQPRIKPLVYLWRLGVKITKHSMNNNNPLDYS